ncbi:MULTISPECIES: mannan-binding lectin [unclassified Roseibium]|uniref:mannan-binding lectin n=1 Tax=unclassified Roseibium TaxID=2629323 RepID=UPI00317F0B2E
MSVSAKNVVKSSALAMLAGVMFASAAGARDIEAGPIWNDEDAKLKCPVAAAAYEGKWNGQWKTTVEGEMSVCGVTDIPIKTLEAGPIWNQEDADKKCPVVGFSVAGKWNGQWWTTVPSQMSVCQVDLNN